LLQLFLLPIAPPNWLLIKGDSRQAAAKAAATVTRKRLMDERRKKKKSGFQITKDQDRKARDR
jgi:hypothetical protein